MKFLQLLLLILIVSCSSEQEIPSEEEVQTPDLSTDDPSSDDTDSANIYFPPLSQDATWETATAASLNWNTNAIPELNDFLERNNTKAFIILYNGRIILETYFNGTQPSENLPWFSAGKTLTAFTFGIAEQEGYIRKDDATSNYLGEGWTNMTEQQESAITLHNQLSMTSGGDYSVSNVNCTDPECLLYLNNPDSFWYYHNAFYTLIQPAMDQALPQDFKTYCNNRIQQKIGMGGQWLNIGYNSIFFSDARSMARFGLLNLNQGVWEEERLLNADYFTTMTTTSQSLNPAYGYLWWLNGKDTFKLPGTTQTFSGKLIPSAPNDLIAGLGANDQKLYVVKSKKLVIVRLGDASEEATLGISEFDNLLWEEINKVIQ